jgi:hypothetical protein
MAVTAYVNRKITLLKVINNNAFEMDFREHNSRFTESRNIRWLLEAYVCFISIHGHQFSLIAQIHCFMNSPTQMNNHNGSTFRTFRAFIFQCRTKFRCEIRPLF